MIAVSEGWKKAHEQMLLPESFVEITMDLTDAGAAKAGTVTASSEAVFSNTGKILTNTGTPITKNYATLEHNLWVLDGSRAIVPDEGPYDNPGFVSADDGDVNITVVLPGATGKTIPGITLTWSSESGEWATDFSYTITTSLSGNGGSVTNNDKNTLELGGEITDCTGITLTISGWSMPDRRKRIDQLLLGRYWTFTKNDILSYTHKQIACPLSTELHKNSIDFSLDNTSDVWNPMNPKGYAQYLSERQPLIVKYGLKVNNRTEWIKAGTFFLSEWKAPANGFEAFFSARDGLDFMMNHEYENKYTTGTLYDVVLDSSSQVEWPPNMILNCAPKLRDVPAPATVDGTVAEILQKCANAANLSIWQDRDGILRINEVNPEFTDYIIPAKLSYSHPEIELLKPIKGVQATMADNKSEYYPISNSGEIVTINNPFMRNANAQVNMISRYWGERTLISGEFRADPRLDVLDVISIESKYSTISSVMITELTYTYNGSFHATYKGTIMGEVV